MEKNTVSVKNISNARVTLSVPELKLRRTIDPKKTVKIDREALQEAMMEPGVIQLFKQQFLLILDEEDREDVFAGELPSQLAPEETYDDVEILKVLESGTELELKKLLDASSKQRKGMIANLAVDAKDITFGKAKMIQDASGVDVVESRKIAAQMKAAEEADATKKANS